MSMLTEKTKVPLGMVAISFVAFVGGIFWLADLHAATANNTEMLTKVVEKQDAQEKNYQNTLETIKIELAEIKTELKHLRGNHD